MKHYKHLLSTLTFLLMILKPATPDPEDQACLSQLYASFTNPTLKNWTTLNFANPCYDGYESHMTGITCNNNRVFRLSLPNSNLAGTISPAITKCTNLQTLDLSSNSLSGDLPSDMRPLANLAVLNLSNNRLSGEIPPSISSCLFLNIIDLHNNQLIGTIPQQLGLLSRLNTFDVSFNRMSGMIPVTLANRSGNLPRFNVSSFVGNKDLYGYPLEPYKNRNLSVTAIVGIGLGSGLLSLIISFTIVCVWLKISEHKRAAAEEAKITHLMPDY